MRRGTPRRASDPTAIWIRRRRLLCFGVTGSAWLTLAGCQVAPPSAYRPPSQPDVTVYVTAAGWHTGIALPVPWLDHAWNRLPASFPDAKFLLFGWGERNYYMARDPGIGDALRALFPGPAVLLVTALAQPPQDALPNARVFAIGLSRVEADRMVAFIRTAFARSPDGQPYPVGVGFSPGSLFYAATGTYSATYTCNTWVAEALHVAGLPVTATGVVFAHEVVDQLRHLPGTTLWPRRGTAGTH